MTRTKNLSLTLASLSLAIFVFAKLIFLMGITATSIVVSGMVTAGLGIAVVSLAVSIIHGFTLAMVPETKQLVRGLQLLATLVLIISLLTGGFGSLLAGYIHF